MDTTRKQIATSIARKKEVIAQSKFKKNYAVAFYGENVFNDTVMKDCLPKEIYEKFKKTITDRAPLDPTIADTVANAMKEWALEKGATHYTHWFQPMTGKTAEKHDSFLEPQEGGSILMEFSGKALIKGEPDASSFPNGGIRATFEARGYTAWDPTSPVFVKKTSTGSTLVIPTAFCSYTGESLDMKTPLLRSQEALSKSVVGLLKILGKKDITKAYTNAGLEQEYFLIDLEFFNHRPDLVATGRTLFGNASYKGQQLDDHYFGAIKRRVLHCMQEIEQELFKLGIPAKTRHNEVAPSQYEIAPVFEDANLATDHNLIIMEVMGEVAKRHGLKLLLHEKPFAGINGSGKHCNWSISDSNGNNLLEPGETPHDNMQFMVVLSAIIRAIDKWAKLLRLSVASAGNDHRLGANEAPPAIISIFLGDDLDNVVRSIIAGDTPESHSGKIMHLGVGTLPPLPKDNTDRNRTSPFAFTGNKFEFRALGSSQNTSGPNFLLNTAVAESFDYIGEQIQKHKDNGLDLQKAVQKTVKEVLKNHERVIFNGDGYSDDWPKEAKKRGLPNLKTTVEALQVYQDQDVIELLQNYRIFNAREVESRFNIKIEKYNTLLSIETNAALDIATTMIIPAALKYQKQLATSIQTTSALLGDKSTKNQKEHLKKTTQSIEALIQHTNEVEKLFIETPENNLIKEAEYYRDKILPAMLKQRAVADNLELLVDDNLWPLPKYREILLLN